MDRYAEPGAAHQVVSPEEWTAARVALLAAEKDFTRLRDDLNRKRRALPWTRVEKCYRFEGPDGTVSLDELFQGRSQLIVYHFMLGPDWNLGCKSCSFWADHFDATIPHLGARDTVLTVISRAPLAKLRAQADRLGWRFPWLSSLGTDFNFDYGVSFSAEDLARGTGSYNYRPRTGSVGELPGFSVFFRDGDGAVYHTYSCYARGLDLMNTTYNLLDLTPKGRDEDGLPQTMAWVRLHDEYAA
jgi:predicted dithiol-disulfide oxidoreductase (DUF899 family)